MAYAFRQMHTGQTSTFIESTAVNDLYTGRNDHTSQIFLTIKSIPGNTACAVLNSNGRIFRHGTFIHQIGLAKIQVTVRLGFEPCGIGKGIIVNIRYVLGNGNVFQAGAVGEGEKADVK